MKLCYFESNEIVVVRIERIRVKSNENVVFRIDVLLLSSISSDPIVKSLSFF